MLDVRLRSTPYVVTCNIFVLYCSWQSYLRTYLLRLLNSFISHDKLRYSIPPDLLVGFKGPTSLPTCLLLTHVALCKRVRGVHREDALYKCTDLLTSVVLGL